MDQKNLRWAAIGTAFALFAAVDLLILLLTPAQERGISLWLPPAISGLVVLITLPSLLQIFEKQQESIERQRREIATLHAMDTAIASEMELGSVLSVAVREATQALDGEHGGILLYGKAAGRAEAFHNVPPDQKKAFRALVRRDRPDEAWEVARVALRRGDEVLGHLAVAKRRPCAPFAPADTTLLTDLTATVVVAVKNARALEAARHLASVEQELVRERRVVQALQEGLLPDIPTGAGSFLFSKLYEAQSDEAEVGGDIYDLFPLGPDRWGVMIADVSGKGLAAARKTAMVKYSLRSFARQHASPGDVAALLNEALFDEPDLTGFVTMVYGVLSDDGGFTYASAGHETPLLRRAAGGVEALAPTGVVLGADRDQRYDEVTVCLLPGDGLLLYTDGLSEVRSGDRQFLEVDGVARMLDECRDVPAGELPAALLSTVSQWAGGRLSDDAALLWVERSADADCPGASAPPT